MFCMYAPVMGLIRDGQWARAQDSLGLAVGHVHLEGLEGFGAARPTIASGLGRD